VDLSLPDLHVAKRSPHYVLRPSAERSRAQAFLEPIDIVLRLFRRKRLSPSEVPVASFVAAFAEQIHITASSDLTSIGEFAATASELLLHKSACLLPWLEAVADDAYPIRRERTELPEQEIILSVLAGRQQHGLETFARQARVGGPGAQVKWTPASAGSLLSAYLKQMQDAATRESQSVGGSLFLRLETATQNVRRALARLRSFSFKVLAERERLDRRQAVVYFLAVLDMARRSELRVQQSRNFGEILISPLSSTSRSAHEDAVGTE
jgi:chromatin segregation and condensation protein Rec8/ScpA/Scc1 (kleisin family)